MPEKGSSLPRREFIARTAAALPLLACGAKAAELPSLKAAVIGHTGRGDYGHGLDRIFANRPGVDLVALADPDEAGRKRAASRLAVPRSHASHRDLLERERPQLVSVTMRHADLHFEIVRDCLDAGAHVYCEKPFVTSPDQADALLAGANSRGLKIAVAHTMRMMPILTRLRQVVREGRIGELVQMRAHGKQDTRAGGEDMMVLGSHLFDLMRMFAGDPVSCSARVLEKGRDITREDRRLVKDNVGFVAGDEVFAEFAFASRVQATFTSSARLRETLGHWGLELLGTKGAARINCDIAPNVFIRRAGEWSGQGRSDSWESLDPTPDKSPPEHNLGPVGDWLDAIAKDREPECSGRNGTWAVEMVSAVYRSALTKARIDLPLTQRAHPLA